MKFLSKKLYGYHPLDTDRWNFKVDNTNNPFKFDRYVYTGPSKKKAVYTSEPARRIVSDAKNIINTYKTRVRGKDNPLTRDKTVNDDSGIGTKLLKLADRSDDDSDNKMKNLLSQIENVMSGNFDYTDSELQQLESIRAMGRQNELRQKRWNTNYEGRTKQGEFRSGRMKFFQELADDNVANAVQAGVDRINDLNIKTQESVSKMEEAIKQNRINQMLKQYGLIKDYRDTRQKELDSIMSNLVNYQKAINQAEKDSYAKYQRDYELAKSEGFAGSYTDFLEYLQKIEEKYKRSSSSSGINSANPYSGSLAAIFG